MFPYCSSGSHDSRLEYRVRYCFLKGDLPGDVGNGEGFHAGRSGGVSLGGVNLGTLRSFLTGEGVARGSLEGLLVATAGLTGGLLDRRMPSKARFNEASRDDRIRFTFLAGELARAPLFATEKLIWSDGDGALMGLVVGDIRFALTSSWGWALLPWDVAGLGTANPRSFASDVFGRARAEAGGRIPDPTLAEKDELDV
jgi:hypothetical protein